MDNHKLPSSTYPDASSRSLLKGLTIARRLALISLLTSIGLAIVKILVGLKAHSSALFADGIESASDVLAAGFLYLGICVAARPADSNHPYGHGRAEPLSSFVLGLLLAATGLGLSLHAILTLHLME